MWAVSGGVGTRWQVPDFTPEAVFLTAHWKMPWKWEAGSSLLHFQKSITRTLLGDGEKDGAHVFSADVLPTLSSTCLFLSNRRELGSTDGVPQISLEDALSSQEVEVAYICSESSSHEDYIRWVFKSLRCTVVRDVKDAWAGWLLAKGS